MAGNNFDNIIERSLALRKRYHELELTHHGSEWLTGWILILRMLWTVF